MSKKTRYAISRTQKNAVIAAFFFLLLPIVVILDHQFGHGLREGIERVGYTSPDAQKYHNKTFDTVEVIDGDTIDINMADGEKQTTRVRLIGVDTPETKHPTLGPMYYGPEATEFTTRSVLNKQVTILLDPASDERDRYDRLLAYVKLADGRILNAELIRQGYGYAYLSFPHSEFAAYRELMDQAIESRAGLWQEVTRDQLPRWLRQERPDLLRYPE